MYLVTYYLSGGTLSRKVFQNMHDATMFCVYKVNMGNVHTFTLIED